MKNFKNYVAVMALFAMIFTSCSKDENSMIDVPVQDLATLSFAPLLDNLDNARAALKQQNNGIPSCSATAPAYVQIVLSNDGGDVVGSMGAPFSIDLVNNQLFTKEVPELQLVPGVYSLDHFAVYNAANELIWLAPKTGGPLANFTDNPLPLAIPLGAGVKKYVDVTVLCFDDRMVNEYGYLFFELNPEKAVKFCFFANYCDDDGRHYSGRISVDVWLGTDATGTPLYTDLVNTTGVNEYGDFFASPICFAVPANQNLDEDYLYYEVTLLDWMENYGSVSEPSMTGTLSMNDIMANFDGDDNVDYEHLRFNCNGDTGGGDPGNGNGGNGGDDPWPPVGDDCETAFMFGNNTFKSLDLVNNRWGWAHNYTGGDGTFSYNLYAAAAQNDITKGYVAGVVTVTVLGEDVTVEIVMNAGYTLDETHIYLSDAAPTTNAPGQYGNTDENPNPTNPSYELTYSGDGNFWIIVHAVTCE